MARQKQIIRRINPAQDVGALKTFLVAKDALRLDLCLREMATNDAIILVSEHAGEAVGLGIIHVRPRLDLGWEPGGATLGRLEAGDAYLENIEVKNELRNHGLGTQLLKALEGEAGRSGNSRAWVHVGEDNVGAQRFYERNGWQHEETGQLAWQPTGRLSRSYSKIVGRRFQDTPRFRPR